MASQPASMAIPHPAGDDALEMDRQTTFSITYNAKLCTPRSTTHCTPTVMSDKAERAESCLDCAGRRSVCRCTITVLGKGKPVPFH